MKTVLIAVLIVVAVGALYYLVEQGYITWQPLTILAAAVAPFFKWIPRLFRRDNEKQIHDRFDQLEAEETAREEEHDNRVAELQREVAAGEARLAELKAEYARLAALRDGVAAEVAAMTTEEKRREGRRLLGTE